MSTCMIDLSLDTDMAYDQILFKDVVNAPYPVKCCECCKMVTDYKRERCTYDEDGEPKNTDTYYTCMDCVEIRDALLCDFIYGNLFDESTWEDILYENNNDIPLCMLDKLTPSAAQKLIASIPFEEEEK